MDAQKIMEYLPHRFPMLLVDRIVEVESGKRIVGIKNVTINEPFFQGHFPGHPIMPGVLIIEAMGQVGGLLLMDAVEKPEDYVVYFMALDNVKWRRPVVPGDQLVFELEMLQFRRHVCRMRGRGLVDGQVVAEADLMARIVEDERSHVVDTGKDAGDADPPLGHRGSRRRTREGRRRRTLVHHRAQGPDRGRDPDRVPMS